MIAIVILFVISVFIMVNMKSKYQYKCFLLTIKDEKKRQERFFRNHDSSIPIEVIYGPDTRNVETAREYEDKIKPKYFKKALEMNYNSDVIRPDITYFNMGAIGCFMGHMEFYDRCFDQGLKYAVIFEDNVIVKSNELYRHIQDVIDKKGDDFEMCFFHCLSRLPFDNGEEEIEPQKCYQKPRASHFNVRLTGTSARVQHAQRVRAVRQDTRWRCHPGTTVSLQTKHPDGGSRGYPARARQVRAFGLTVF